MGRYWFSSSCGAFGKKTGRNGRSEDMENRVCKREQKGNNCYRCRHFRITWQAAMPYACKAYGFKARQLPSLLVMSQSGQACLMYAPKASQRG